jgi:hypothetical protein
MGLPDLIDFSTSCPWELYLFAFWHLFAGATFYYFDACPYLTSKPCTDAERFWERIVALSLVYVGVIVSLLLLAVLFDTRLKSSTNDLTLYVPPISHRSSVHSPYLSQQAIRRQNYEVVQLCAKWCHCTSRRHSLHRKCIVSRWNGTILDAQD